MKPLALTVALILVGSSRSFAPPPPPPPDCIDCKKCSSSRDCDDGNSCTVDLCARRAGAGEFSPRYCVNFEVPCLNGNPSYPALNRCELTGSWEGNDGSLYSIRQIGDRVWWLGMSRHIRTVAFFKDLDDFHMGVDFTNVFQGRVACPPRADNDHDFRRCTISGQWAEVPRGTTLNHGRATLTFEDVDPGDCLHDAPFHPRIINTTAPTGGLTVQSMVRGLPPLSDFCSPLCSDEDPNPTDIACRFKEAKRNDDNSMQDHLTLYKDYVTVTGTLSSGVTVGYPPPGARPPDRSYPWFMCACTDPYKWAKDCDPPDGDITFGMDIERQNGIRTGLHQQPGFWVDSWQHATNADCDEPHNGADEIRRKLADGGYDIEAEVIMYGWNAGANNCTAQHSALLLPGWADNSGNSVLLNGRPVNGWDMKNVVIEPVGDCPNGAACPVRSILGLNVANWNRIRVTGALAVDCHGTDCHEDDAHEHNQEIHPVFGIDVINGTARANITGAWAASDVGTYYVRQFSDHGQEQVWWLGMSQDKGRRFTNVFHGVVLDDGITISGEWADVPFGRAANSGWITMTKAVCANAVQTFGECRLSREANRLRTEWTANGIFGAYEWEKLYDR